MGKVPGLTTAVFIVSVAAFAQTSTQSAPRQSTRSSSKAMPSDSTTPMTVVGCLMKEADYRQAHGLGKGALGGAGLGDEFVLVDTSTVAGKTSSGTSTSSAKSNGAAPSASAATCSETGNGPAYRLTGQLESKLKPFVGHRMEVTGTFDHPRDARTAAGETNAKLPAEIKISSYREAAAMTTTAPATTEPQGTAGITTPAPANTTPSTAPAAPANTAPPSTTAPATTRTMPKTASNQPLFALLGLLSLSGALGVRALRRRLA